MNSEQAFDYYYGDESNQFSFYRIPRQLIIEKEFRNLSADAKLLYGLLLDRMGLSASYIKSNQADVSYSDPSSYPLVPPGRWIDRNECRRSVQRNVDYPALCHKN